MGRISPMFTFKMNRASSSNTFLIVSYFLLNCIIIYSFNFILFLKFYTKK